MMWRRSGLALAAPKMAASAVSVAARTASRAASQSRLLPNTDDRLWNTTSATLDLVLVDREGRGYGDDYSPWLVDAPVGRLCTAEVPIPYAKHLELAALPSVDRVVVAARQAVSAGG